MHYLGLSCGVSCCIVCKHENVIVGSLSFAGVAVQVKGESIPTQIAEAEMRLGHQIPGVSLATLRYRLVQKESHSICFAMR